MSDLRLASSLVLLLSSGFAAMGHAQIDADAQSLTGVRRVAVVVESMSEGQQALGLSEFTIQTDVELRLRQAGIQVVSAKEPHDAWLYVQVTTTIGPGSNAWHVHLGLNQVVTLARNPTLVLSEETWQARGRIGLSPEGQIVEPTRNAVRDQVDQFLNAWLAANPPQR